jgi:hypothetical protein
MTSQIGGAEVYDVEEGVEIRQLSPSASPLPSVIKKHEENLRKKHEPVIRMLIGVWNTKPMGRAPELGPDSIEMLDKLTDHINTIMTAPSVNLSFDKDAFKSSIKKMLHKLHTFLHSKRRKVKTVRGGMKPRIENRASSPGPANPPQHPAGNPPSPPQSDDDQADYDQRGSRRSRSSDVSWTQHCMMMILMMCSMFMGYIAYIKFQQTLETVTSTGTVGELKNIVDEIARVFQEVENGFLSYVLRIFTKPQADIELYYTGQLTQMITTAVERSVKAMSAQIKSTCGGDPIFQDGALAVGGIDIGHIASTIINSAIGALNSAQTTECIKETVQAMTREQFHKIETQITLIVAKILQNQNVIRWLLSAATAFAVPPVRFYVRLFTRTIRRYVSRRGASADQERAGRPGSPRGDGFLALPPPSEGGGRKARSRRFLRNKKSRRVVFSRKRRN